MCVFIIDEAPETLLPVLPFIRAVKDEFSTSGKLLTVI